MVRYYRLILKRFLNKIFVHLAYSTTIMDRDKQYIGEYHVNKAEALSDWKAANHVPLMEEASVNIGVAAGYVPKTNRRLNKYTEKV